MPNTIPQSVSQPLIQFLKFEFYASQSEVIYPSSRYFFESPIPLLEAIRQGFLGNKLELSF